MVDGKQQMCYLAWLGQERRTHMLFDDKSTGLQHVRGRVVRASQALRQSTEPRGLMTIMMRFHLFGCRPLAKVMDKRGKARKQGRRRVSHGIRDEHRMLESISLRMECHGLCLADESMEFRENSHKQAGCFQAAEKNARLGSLECAPQFCDNALGRLCGKFLATGMHVMKCPGFNREAEFCRLARRPQRRTGSSRK